MSNLIVVLNVLVVIGLVVSAVLAVHFEKLLSSPMGGGYPEAWAAPEKKNRGILAEVKKVTHKDMLTVLKEIDQDFLKQTVGEPNFAEMFFANCKNEEIAAYIRGVLA